MVNLVVRQDYAIRSIAQLIFIVSFNPALYNQGDAQRERKKSSRD